MTGVDRGVEITTIADLPAGIGLGSSSTLTVGVLNALDALGGHRRSPADLARRACEIEIEILQKPIGKQDQYIAAYGGLQDIYFHRDDTVSVHPVLCPPERRDQLVRRLMLFYTGAMFQGWQGRALMAGLGSKALVAVAIDGESAREVARFPFAKRLRAIAQGPDGALWVAEDGKGARLLKLTTK